MPNTNCLENLACPQCGNQEVLLVVATVTARVHDDGVESYHDPEWHPASPVSCPRCQHHDVLSSFEVVSQGPTLIEVAGWHVTHDDSDAVRQGAQHAARMVLTLTCYDESTEDPETLVDALGDLMCLVEELGLDRDRLIERACGYADDAITTRDGAAAPQGR